MSQLAVIAKEHGLAPTDELYIKLSNAEERLNGVLADSLRIKVTSEDDLAGMAMAKEMRLKLKALRTGTEQARKTHKEEYLRKGQAVDALARWIKEKIEPEERRLLDAENYAVLRENERKEALKRQRTEALMAVGANPAFYDLANIPEPEYRRLLQDVTAEFDRAQMQKAEEEVAELERQRQAKKRADELVKENERLRGEASIIAATTRANRLEAERTAELHRAELAETNRKLAEVQANERRDREAREKKERDDAAAAAAETEREAARVRMAAMQPDAEKIITYCESLQAVPVPAVGTAEGRKLLAVAAKIMVEVEYLKSNTRTMFKKR